MCNFDANCHIDKQTVRRGEHKIKVKQAEVLLPLYMGVEGRAVTILYVRSMLATQYVC